MKNLILVFTIMCSSYGLLLSQDSTLQSQKSPIKVIQKRTDNGVKLRWAPTTKESWYLLQQASYEIYRASFSRKLPRSEDYKKVATVQVQPADHFAALVDDSSVDDYYKLVGMSTYGEWETTKPGNKSIDNWGHKMEELESRYLTIMYSCDMSYAAAEAVGLAYFDKSASDDQNYAYKIVIPSDSLAKPIYKIVLKADKVEVPTVQIYKGDENENQVVVSWERVSHEKNFTAYHIEKSKDDKNYIRLTDKPYINAETSSISDLPYIVFMDSVSNYDPHYYRVVGIDAFGDESEPSKPMRLMGRDRTPPASPVIDSAYLSDDQSNISLEWHFDQVTPDLQSIIVKKGPQFEGPYFPIEKLNNTALSYKDLNPSLINLQYFQVCAIDTAGNEACSAGKYAIFDDKVAPKSPKGLTGTIDSSGIVTLRWALGEEEDLLGYFVHKSNGKGRVFANLTNKPVRDVIWHDTITLHTLTEKVYYKVNAVDLRKNYSPFSEIIELTKPDTIPPNPSIFKNYTVGKEEIQLVYALSGSKDVQTITLQKTAVMTNEIENINLDKGTTSYTDTNIKSDTKYKYELITQDDAGLITMSPQALVLTTKDVKNFHSVNLEYTESEEDITLKWDAPKGEVDFVKIYKGKKEATTLSFKSIRTGNSATFSKKVLKDQFLKVKIFYKNGAKSAFSNVVRVG